MSGPMATTLREYFETDFSYAVRLDCFLEIDGVRIEARYMCDFAGFKSFLSLFVPGVSHTLPFYINILRSIEYGKSELHFTGRINLPNGWEFPGQLQVRSEPNNLVIRAQFHGDPRWV